MTDETPKQEKVVSLLHEAWDSVNAVGKFTSWRHGDQITVYFDEIPREVSVSDIGGDGRYRLICVRNGSSDLSKTATIEVQEYPSIEE